MSLKRLLFLCCDICYCVMKLAMMLFWLLPIIKVVNALVEVRSPLQPVKLKPELGVACAITEIPAGK